MRVPSRARPAFGANAVRSRAPVRGTMPSSVSPLSWKEWSHRMTDVEESGHEVAGDGRLARNRRRNSRGRKRAREGRDPLERDRKVRDPMFELVFEFVQGLLHCPSANQETGFP